MIDDVSLRQLDVNPTRTGSLVELQRADWEAINEDTPPQMSVARTVFPGTTSEWRRHPDGQVDHLTVIQGQVELALYDGRPDAATHGETNSFVLGESSPLLVRVPAGVWHAYRVLGQDSALLLDFPSELYDYYDPDLETRPADSESIPFEWD